MTTKKGTKLKLIDLLEKRGLCDDRDKAGKLIMAGLVRVDGEVVDKLGAAVSAEAEVTVGALKEFVSRAAYKLEAALTSFPIAVSDRTCADVGACTGGFTELLLRNGAKRVYAIDVGYGDLNWRVRSDPRVVVMERTNARYLESLPEPVSLVVIDVSFISLDKILPAVVKWLGAESADVIALIKPQFEAEREEIESGGIVRDSGAHRRIISRIEGLLPELGLLGKGVVPSPILGAEGNQEFLLWATKERSDK